MNLLTLYKRKYLERVQQDLLEPGTIGKLIRDKIKITSNQIKEKLTFPVLYATFEFSNCRSLVRQKNTCKASHYDRIKSNRLGEIQIT